MLVSFYSLMRLGGFDLVSMTLQFVIDVWGPEPESRKEPNLKPQAYRVHVRKRLDETLFMGPIWMLNVAFIGPGTVAMCIAAIPFVPALFALLILFFLVCLPIERLLNLMKRPVMESANSTSASVYQNLFLVSNVVIKGIMLPLLTCIAVDYIAKKTMPINKDTYLCPSSHLTIFDYRLDIRSLIAFDSIGTTCFVILGCTPIVAVSV